MALRILKYIFLSALTLLVLAVFVFAASSRMSMDKGFAHTSDTKDLPAFTRTSGTGIVRIDVGDMTFRARIAGFDGDLSKPVVILLHGFPVTSAMWIDLIGPLEEAGYRVIAFDQRGYSPGARPEALDAYAIPPLTNDVFQIADAIGAEDFHLVGHDWGAVVGWSVVLTDPSRVKSWTALSIAHPASFQAALLDDPDQQKRSRYFFLFRTPWVPETLLSFNNFAMLRTVYAGMSEQQQSEYISVFSEPGAMTSALNWYRAMGDAPADTFDVASLDVATPTLFIWGNQDAAVGRVATETQAEFIKGPYTNIEINAGHWLFVDQPERVVSETLAHIALYSQSQATQRE